MKKVLVTGATGFIALHCIEQLLRDGYAVRSTVRTPSRISEVKDAIAAQGLEADTVEFTQADLMNTDGWDEAVKGCEYVLHVASPFIVGLPKHEDELIIPAVRGTETVISAAIRHKVKRVVLTSSCAAITDTFDGRTHFTEADWSDTNHPKTSAYYKSKTLAERKAWELIEAQSQKGKTTELSVINPAGVIGPSLTDDIGTANEFVRKILAGEVPGCPRLHLGFVDVRDVATAHILAMTHKEAAGERFIISEREFWFKEFCAVLRDAGYKKAPTIQMPDFMVRLFGLFDPATRQIGTMLGAERYTPSDKAKSVLGWKPRDARDSIRETATQIIEKKLV